MDCRKFILILLLVGTANAFAQPAPYRITRSEYIEKYKDEAIFSMNTYGIPASIKLAQAMLESDNGNSRLAKTANNHFGIKCHKGWTGPSIKIDDDEKNECFRKYKSELDSYNDHSEFLKGRDRYAFLFELDRTDYKAWAHGLKKAGYATNPKYPQLLIKIIEDNDLHDFDRPGGKSVFARKSKSKSKDTSGDVSIDAVDQVMKINNVKYIIAKNGDTPNSIAKRNEMMPWQIIKYNDFEKNSTIIDGQIIYLQPKRNNAGKDYHIVQVGERMEEISQAYAVKLKKLYQKNNMKPGDQPVPGQKISLKKRL
ncbi:MAG: glucosaminidase domain-containing protein [Bacteroidia bacterium]